MKKRTAIWLAILMLFCAAASSCGLSADEPSEKVGVARLVTTEYPVQISRTPHVTGSYAPEISVIRTREELIRYVSVYEKCYDFLDETEEMFYDIVSLYKEDYFTAKALVICVIHSRNATIRYKSEGIGRNGEEYNLRIRVSAPTSSTGEETDWHMFLEVPDSCPFLRDSAVITVRYVEARGY